MTQPPTSLPGGDLAELAHAYGVATTYEDQQGRTVRVSAETVVTTLAALGVDASGAAAVTAALAETRVAPLRRLAPPVAVLRCDVGGAVDLHPDAGVEPEVRLELEDGGTATGLTWRTVHVAPVDVDGRLVGTRILVLPAGLPLGWHRLTVRAGGREQTTAVVVAPARLELPAELHRAWGWMVQLYAVRSARSWAVGDLGDLTDLVRWSAGTGAGLVMCNPLHAVAPTLPMQPSPYYPASRRFVNPVYLRVEQVPEYATADEATRARVDELGAPARADVRSDLVDRDTAWEAKRRALEVLWVRCRRRSADLAAYRAAQRPGVDDFATWCALAEEFGPDWQQWPEPLRRPDTPEVDAARRQLRDRVDFYVWLQMLCDEQLAAAQDVATRAGMAVGVVHDLAIGVDPGGADAWALQDVLALRARVGAPPDAFSQQGQDWGLPPWRPDRLAEAAYAPFRDLVRGVLRRAGAIRIDHILGLFRLWWVPEGQPASHGTYVRYDAAALLGILTLEAHRAGAIVVGEDLGTVEPQVQTVLHERGILGSAVLWFEGKPLSRWRELALASVTTHDLPTATGFLRGEHVRVRAVLDQLARPVAEEQATADAERAALLALLRREGLLPEGADEEETVLAMHRALTRTPCRLLTVALGDAVGDLRQPNLPGTTEEYPNWRLPVAEPAEGGERPLLLEDLEGHPGVARLVAVMREGLAAGR